MSRPLVSRFRLGALALATTMALGVAMPALADTTANPLETASPLPFQAPPFDRIKESDYLPAFELGMKQQRAEVRAIADNPAAPTFENTYVALEKSGVLLNRVSQVFFGVVQANTDDTLQKVQEQVAPELAAHADAIHMDSRLFSRLGKIYQQRHQLKLDPESLRLVEVTYRKIGRAHV